MKKQLLAVLALSTVLSGSVKAEAVNATSPMNNYNPEPVSTSKIETMWSEMRTDWTLPGWFNSGNWCFARAHVWSYEMVAKHNVESIKVLAHYTNMFRDAVNMAEGKEKFDWVFHIAPAVINEYDEVIVMDKAVGPRISGTNNVIGPREYSKWLSYLENQLASRLNNPAKLANLKRELKKNLNSRSKKNQVKAMRIAHLLNVTPKDENGNYIVKCKEIEHIIDHDTDTENWCHSQKTSMYYYNQYDIRGVNYGFGGMIGIGTRDRLYTQRAADSGVEQTQFTSWSLKNAYKKGFGIGTRKMSKIHNVKKYKNLPTYSRGTVNP